MLIPKKPTKKAATKKAVVKKSAPKKAATKKAAPKKAAVKKTATKFEWTDAIKEAAKAQLLAKYNAVETEKLKTLISVFYQPDGIAKTGGKKGNYIVNMN